MQFLLRLLICVACCEAAGAQDGPKPGVHETVAAHLEQFARFADQQALAHFRGATLPRLPNNSVPPISEEDLAFYELLGSVSGPHRKSATPLIWGLDAEYRAAPLLKRLAELSPRIARRQALQSLLEQVEAAERSGGEGRRRTEAASDVPVRRLPCRPAD